MAEWTLVVPVNLTKEEREVVMAFRGDSKVRIRFMGRAELDNLFADYPELIRMADRSAMVDLLRQARHERDGLVGPDDLNDRIRELGELSDSRDENWGVAFRRNSDGSVVNEIFAKRADAATRSPIKINLTTTFGPEHQALRESFQQAMDFGTLTPVVLPPEVVTAFEIDGPEWLARTEGPSHVEMHPILAKEPVPCEIRVVSASGATRASLHGSIASVAAGRKGLTFSSNFLDCLTLRFRLPEFKSGKTTGRLDVSINVTGKSASAALRVLRFADLLCSGESLQMVVKDQQVFRTGTFSPEASGHESDPEYMEIADDLSYLEREFGLTFPMPDRLSPSTRVQIRMVRMLAEGKCVIFFGTDEFTATMTKPTVPLEDALQTVLDGTAHQQLLTTEPWQAEILGQVIEMESLKTWHPSVALVDAEKVRQAFDDGEEEVPIVMRPTDGTGFRAVVPERGPGLLNEPQKFKLRSLPEPPGFPEPPSQD
jgi:hypothetical protein